MSLLNYLTPQTAKETVRDLREDDTFLLDDQIDEDSLDLFWERVVADIHSDPEWYNFKD
jgi:hypothetical protein